MDLAVITFKQVFVLFLLMLAGVVCTRAGGVHPGDKRAFSDLLLNLVVPAMVVNSYLTEYNPSTGHNLLRAFGWSLLVLLAGFAITFFLIRNVRGEQLSIRRFACIFSNSAYMGFPLIESLFGAEGLLYASAYVTMFNLLLWTIGAAMVSGETRRREIAASILRTPVLYAVVAGLIIYFLRIPVPEIIQKPLGLIGAMNTPLSMFITGMLIASSRLVRVIRNRLLWGVMALRMLVIPAVCIALFAVLGFRGMVGEVVLLLEACPCAAITSIFAVRYHHDEEFAAGLVVVSTLISIVTLPLCAMLLATVL